MSILVIFHVACCLFLVGVILLQPGKSDGGIGFGASSSQSIFGSRGAGNFLTKTTGVCAILFLFTSLLLTRDRVQKTTKTVTESVPMDAAPAVPAAPKGTESLPTEKAKAN